MAPSLNGHVPDSPTLKSVSNGAGDDDMSTLIKRYEQYEAYDLEKTKFMGVGCLPPYHLLQLTAYPGAPYAY
jgi:hypothetical protein